VSLKQLAVGWLLLPLLGSTLVSRAAAVAVPTNFVVDNAVPAATFDTPTGIAFLPDGSFIVSEQAGVAWMVRNGVRLTNPVWGATGEILNNGDRGLLGIAVDPDYFLNHFIYFLYTVDPDTNGVDDSPHTFGRLTRYRMRATGDTNTVDPATRTILLGVDWTHGVLDASTSHHIGSLRFGRDKSLFVSMGDGADFNVMDAGGLQPAAFGPGKTDPFADIGAFRAQDITNLNGKILRINPANGHGYASNPYADSDLTSVRSRVWSYGLRNPFRFTVRPGTGSPDTTAGNPGTLYVGDVGWDKWEEADIVTQGGQNLGWPCMEGFHTVPLYQAGAPAHNGCGSVGTATNPAPWRPPAADWNHSDPALGSPAGASGITSIGGVFYTDSLYPASYRSRYFFADYGASWIRVATFSGNQNLISIANFGTSMDGPVDLERSPVNGDLYYTSITTGQIRRIRYTGAAGGNSPPVALAIGSPSTGNVPLSVNFSSVDSFDPDGDPLLYSWAFGDGGTSTLPNPTHVYAAQGSFTAVLTVTDGRGGQSQSQVLIVAGSNTAFPTTSILDSFNRANGPLGAPWTTTSLMSIQGNALQVTGPGAISVFSASIFGPDQECYLTLGTIPANPTEMDLMLKVQGLTGDTGHIEIWYDKANQRVVISTFHPTAGWQQWGVLSGVTFAAGDRLGGRAFATGVVEVFKNGAKLGQVSVTGWPFYALGGRLGLTMGATGAVLDDFGGGNWTPVSPVPIVTVASPNGGESWVGGSSHPITWTATDDLGVTGVDVYYRDTAIAPWTAVASNLTNSGSFNWFVPNTPGSAVKVRVIARDVDGNAGVDSSNATFTISATPGGIVHTTLRDFQMPGTQPLAGGAFQDHNTCYTCHGGYSPAVEPGHNFRGTMMGQAARDPLFYACLAIAEQDAPASGDLCIRCHSPMAWLAGRSQPTNGSQIDALGRDGVSCDFCHRLVDPIYVAGVNPVEDQAVLNGMLPAHRPTGYSNGQYVVDDQARRRGPLTDPVTPHAFLVSSFHERSEMCGTCHDVSNPVFQRAGDAKYAPGPLDSPADSINSAVLMPLERTFSEWKNSAFPSGVFLPDFAGNLPGGIVSQCQDCHLRSATGTACNNGGVPVRTDLAVHDLTGGNAWMGGVIADLYPTETDPGALKDAAGRAVSMLQKAASLQLSTLVEGDSFRTVVRITNRTGHKLPAIPRGGACG
jgi:glucose/arabinose dehydrogenase